MTSEPPPFQEANRCDVCKCSFTTFRRRHHCRCCGRTLCNEHSTNQMPLPQFGLHSNVRVCAECFNESSRFWQEILNRQVVAQLFRKDDSVPSLNGINHVSEAVSRLDIHDSPDFRSEPTLAQNPVLNHAECKCGMPLCICAAPTPSNEGAPAQVNIGPISTSPLKPKPKKTGSTSTPKSRRTASDNKQSSSFGPGHSDGALDKPRMNYEANGEGLREAIKNGDVAAVKELLSKGVDSNYNDKQGFSLLHLAALFNQTEIAFVLMDHGARLDCKNSQGETPLDCAPATLQYKMRMKIGQL